MSLMRTLARVAVGVAVAKGAKSLTQNARAGKSGTMLDDMLGPNAKTGSGGGLGGLLDSLRGTQATGQRAQTSSARTGGLGGLLSGLQGGGTAGAGGLGGIMGALAGAAGASAAGQGFGQKLQSQMHDAPDAAQTPEPAQEGLAAIMLLAMVQAAQADGQMDEIERSRIRDHLNDATDAEREFVNQAMNTKISTDDLAAQVPEGAEAQVYAMSLMAIDLNHPAEVDFLRGFADALGLQSDAVNDIHAKMGAVPLYS